MKQHILAGAIAVLISLAGVAGVAGVVALEPLEIITRVAQNDTWLRLTEPQKAVLSEMLKAIPGLKLKIQTSADCECAGLAQDIDEAARSADVESTIKQLAQGRRGIGAVSDRNGDDARAVADAIAAVTGGRLKPSSGLGDGKVQGTLLSIGKNN
jgi:hypothetical protein